MNPIAAIRYFFSNAARQLRQSLSPSGPTSSRRGLFGGWWSASPTGGSVTGAMAVATAYRCVRVIADTASALPLRVMRRRGDIYTPDNGSLLTYLLSTEPNEYTNGADFWSAAWTYILLHGNAYIVPDYDHFGDAVQLRLCTPNTVSYDPYTDTYDISDILQGINGRYAHDQVIHLRGLTLDGKTGVSVLTFARLSLDISARGSKEQEKRFATGGTVRGLVGNAQTTAKFGSNRPEQLQDVAEHVSDRLDAGDNVIALPGSVDFKQLSMSSADMQFLESRKFEVREICRFFGVHPSFVFDDTSNNYKSAETANAAFLTNTLNPLLRRVELELTRKLFKAYRRGSRIISYDRPALFALDLDSLARHQRSRLEVGTATINELRRESNLPPIEGGDIPMVSANLRPLSELAKPVAESEPAPQEPAPEPEPTTEPQPAE